MAPPSEPRLAVALVGHVDHGKSTVLVRLLLDAGAIPAARVRALEERCRRRGRPFEYAYLLDALEEERAQGITIDTARCFFRTARREYLFLDAPGHEEFLRNMVTGAAQADAAVLVVDAAEGVRANTRRHASLLRFLGVGALVVAVNKMDRVHYRAGAFGAVREALAGLLGELDLRPAAVIPLSGREGDNVVRRSDRMPWYTGPTLLAALEGLTPRRADAEGPLRFPVQDVYRFSRDRRIVVGRVESGVLRPGLTVAFYPSGKTTQVAGLEAFGSPPPAAVPAGSTAGLTLAEELYVRRGEVLTTPDAPPAVATRFRARLLWLGRRPLRCGVEYTLKLATAAVPAVVESLEATLDPGRLTSGGPALRLERHAVGEGVVRVGRRLAVDPVRSVPALGRFVLVADHRIVGGGSIEEILEDDLIAARRGRETRARHWIPGGVDGGARAARLGQHPALVLVTGPPGSGRKAVARALEERLFAAGRLPYYLAFGSVVYGLDQDLRDRPDEAEEHLRRFGEAVHLLLDAGLLVIATARTLGTRDLAALRTLLAPRPVLAVDLSARGGGDRAFDLRLAGESPGGAAARIAALLDDRGVC